VNITHSIEVGKMDELGRSDSPIHRLDARVKIVTTVAFIMTVMSFGHDTATTDGMVASVPEGCLI